MLLSVVLVAPVVSVVVAAPAVAAGEGDFTIVDGSSASPVLIDASYGGEHGDRAYRQVRRAVQDLRQDVAMVSGGIDAAGVQAAFADDEASQEARLAAGDPAKVPALLTEAGTQESAIIVGVIGESDLIDGIIDAGKFDEAEPIADEWEAYAIKRVENPVPGIAEALVIAGSDARGAVYGTYSISERIGVSPWYWFSDVPVDRADVIAVDGAASVNEGPDVPYRGIFINDEEQTIEWAEKKFPTAKGTPDVNYYRHVYEMMLRLKMNTLWSAMHSTSTAFNAATDTGMHDGGTPINAAEAGEFGIIMSTSHAEPMLRNNVDEWEPFYERNKVALNIQGADYEKAFDYSINKPAILAYWRERQVANAEFENVLVLGLRALHDNAPAFTANNPYGFTDRIQMVGDAITEQRKMIAEIYGSVEAVPQVFVPYKEMGDYYNNGLKAYIPEDVTLMWAEDNFGYLRQVPTDSEAARSGGNGVYYHNSYWGSPRSYLWLNSAPMGLMVEQLHRAWNSDARKMWMLNVGDIKPGEIKAELFSKLAWDVEGYDDSNMDSRFFAEQVERDYGLTGDAADEMVDALSRFDVLESTKRAEWWGISYALSVTADGDEVQRHINEANELVEIAEDAAAAMDASYRSAFTQQVVHRFRGYRDIAQHVGYNWKNQQYATQGRYGSVGVYAQLSKAARDRIHADEVAWNQLSNGKWDDAIHNNHPGGGLQLYSDGQYATVAAPSDGVGATAEGQTTPGAGTLRFNSAGAQDERFFDVFNKNSEAEGWVAEADAPWVSLSESSGVTGTERRVTVKVDWSKLNATATAGIRVYNAVDGVKAGAAVATFTVDAVKAAVDLAAEAAGHVEANGYVLVEAENFAENIPGSDGTSWTPVEAVAQRGDVMKAVPETADRVDTNFATTARLKYRVHFTSTGSFTGTFYRVPTLNEGKEDNGTARSARATIGLDNQVPTSSNLRGCAQTGCGAAWGDNVRRQIEPLAFTINVATPGWHDIVVYRSDAAVEFDRIVIPTKTGAVGDSLVGPVESPNNIAEGEAVQTATVAPLPRELAGFQPLPPVTVELGASHTIQDVAGVVEAVSNNPTAATVAVQNGQAVVTAERAGTAQIVVTDGEDVSYSFTVTVPWVRGPELGAYIEKDGQFVINAYDALEKSAFANAVDSNNGTHAWTLSRNGVQVVPPSTPAAKAQWLANDATQGQALLTATPTQKVNGSSASGTPPRLEFTVDVTTAGTYYLWVNTSNPSGDSDSYFVAVDDQWKYSSVASGETGLDTWYSKRTALTLTPGQHKVSLWAREAGLLVNQVAVTTNTAPTFSGLLPASDRVVPTPAVDVTAEASVRCVAGKGVLAVQARNNGDAPVDLVITSTYGTKNVADLGADKRSTQSFTTRLAAVPAGTVTTTATPDGSTTPVTIETPYEATNCG